MQVNESSLFFVFDVESVGLYGEGFAVGWTVVDLDGKEHDSGIYSTSPFNVRASKVEPNVMEWVKKNCPEFEKTSNRHLCLSFWDKLQQWWVNSPVSGYKNHPKVCTFWADWASPVEITFLEKVAAEAYYAHLADDVLADVLADVLNAVPAPLHEIATLQLAAGITGDLPRLPSELPEHNPLNDARHSARKLVRAMARLKQLSGSGFNVERYNNPGVPAAPVFCHYKYKIVGQSKTWVFHSMEEATLDMLECELRRAREMDPEQNYQIVQLFCVKNWNDLRMRVGKQTYGSMETL